MLHTQIKSICCLLLPFGLICLQLSVKNFTQLNLPLGVQVWLFTLLQPLLAFRGLKHLGTQRHGSHCHLTLQLELRNHSPHTPWHRLIHTVDYHGKNWIVIPCHDVKQCSSYLSPTEANLQPCHTSGCSHCGTDCCHKHCCTLHHHNRCWLCVLMSTT